MKEIIDVIHKSIYPFFDVCEDEEEPLSDKDKLLLEVNKAICNNLKALEQEPKTGWIPCSERLPEDRRAVFVTAYWHETYQVMMASYYGDGLWWCVPFNNCGKHMQRLKPIAWMPLPKPYKAESEGKK